MKSSSQHIVIAGQELDLLPQKGIFWAEREILLLADLHFGKINHFRKAGIPVPEMANQKNSAVLIDLFRKLEPKRVIFLGDLFHSHYNPEWEVLGQIIEHFPAINFELVRGNHDILSMHQYQKHNIRVYQEILTISPFVLSHHPLDEVPEGQFNLAGHIHPGVKLRGKGRQAVTLPCYYFTEKQGLVPAFGAFTGLYKLNPRKEDKVYIVVEDRVFQV